MTNNEIKTEVKRLHKEIEAANTIERGLWEQVRVIQGQCPHPFKKIQWDEWVPMGYHRGYRGSCKVCGAARNGYEYSKEELDTVEFVFKE